MPAGSRRRHAVHYLLSCPRLPGPPPGPLGRRFAFPPFPDSLRPENPLYGLLWVSVTAGIDADPLPVAVTRYGAAPTPANPPHRVASTS
jgi:hypothetical protein